MTARYIRYVLEFNKPAGTSRGVLRQKETFYIVITDGNRVGIGECGILRGLSADDVPDYEEVLSLTCKRIDEGLDDLYSELADYPSIQFGLEQAFADLKTEELIHYFDSGFFRGKAGQPINGLIWMGDRVSMTRQIEERLSEGFSCLKMKIGAIDWSTELGILKAIRERYPADQIELRLDANGAFSPEQAESVLDELEDLGIHSIEQPIAAGQWEVMARLCRSTEVPIALDEELIGIPEGERRTELLKAIEPQFVILKPSFIGGWRGSVDWIHRAEAQGTGWWVTSALESNIGLNAIAEWTATLNNSMCMGLGTGSLYTNNIAGPLVIRKGELWTTGTFDPAELTML